MEPLGQIETLFAHDAWANRAVLAALEEGDDLPEVRRLFAHVIASGYLWLARIRGVPSPLPVWPELSLEECRARLSEITADWAAFLEQQTAKSLGHEVSYTNSKGERWTSTVEAISIHVAQHGSYHRGQIASRLVAAGRDAPYTDYIHAARTGQLG